LLARCAEKLSNLLLFISFSLENVKLGVVLRDRNLENCLTLTFPGHVF